MAIPPLGVEPSPFFALLAKLRGGMTSPACRMGMSAIFEAR
jgi:hypothetical protein